MFHSLSFLYSPTILILLGEEKKVPFNRLIKPIDVAKGLAFMCSEESGLMTGSVIDFDQTVHGWHSYSAYETRVLDDSLLGE